MTDAERQIPLTVAGDAKLSAGALLRARREACGMHIGALAGSLKVPLSKLEALEADRYDQLPDLTFARGLASSVCRALGINAAPVLARMPAAPAGLTSDDSAAINAPFRRISDRPTPILATGPTRRLLIGVLLLLLLAAGLWLLPTLPIQLTPPVASTPTPDKSAAMVTPVPAGDAIAPVSAEMPVGAASAEQGAATPQEAASAPSANASAAAADTVAPAVDGLLVLQAVGETWVSVRDAAGKQLINRAMTKDETVALNGAVPLSVTVGRKDAVRVTVRGQPFDLAAAGRSNVARFQVK